MPVGTVRGRYELDAPALRTLRELERQGIRTQKQMKSLGAEMDKVGGQRDVAQLREYDQATADLRRTSERTHREMRADWRETTRVVRLETTRQRTAIGFLQRDLDRLGATRASPTIDIDGVTAAIAQVDLLERKLDGLGRRRATPTVSSGGLGSFTPAGGSGTPGPRQPRLGGGGGGGRSRGPIDFGMRGIRPRNLAIGGALAFARPLVGAGSALALSAGSAAGGLGALGITGLGAGLIGGGLGVATGKTISKPIQEVYKAQTMYNQQVALHGRLSTQAAGAQDKLNLALSKAPEGTQRFLKELNQLRTTWRKATVEAQGNLIQGAGGFLGGVRSGIRGRGGFASSAAVATGAIGTQATNFGQFLGSGAGRRGVSTGAGIFAENLPMVEKDLEHIYVIFTNIMRASRPFFRDINRDLEGTLARWERGTSNIEKTRTTVGAMVGDLKAWGRLVRETGRLLIDLGKAGGAKQGSRLVDDLTKQVEAWDHSVVSNPQRTRNFFKESVDSTKRLAKALGGVVKALDEMLKRMGPLLDGFTTITGLAGDLNLLGPLGAYAAYRKFSGGFRGGGGAAGAAGGGVAEAAGAGATGAALVAGRGGAALEGPALAGSRVYGAGFRYGAPTSQLGARGLRGGIGRGATRVRGALGRGARGFGRAAGPFALFTGAYGALTTEDDPYASTGTNALRRIQGAGSALTLGLISQPYSTDPAAVRARQAKAGGRADARTGLFISPGGTIDPNLNNVPFGVTDRDFIAQARAQQLSTPGAYRGTRMVGGTPIPRSLVAPHPRSYYRNEADYQLAQRASGGGGTRGGHPAPLYAPQSLSGRIGVLGVARRAAQHTLDTAPAGSKQYQDAAAAVKAYTDALKGLRSEQRALARQRADRTFSDIAQAYDTMVRRFGKKRALEQFNKDLVSELRKAGPAGKRELGRAGAAWVETQRRTGRLTAKEAKDANQTIIEDFKRLGKRVRISNGQIFDGSREQWAKIEDVIGSHAEKAAERGRNAFTQLQRDAIAALNAMGISGASARHIVRMTDADSSKSSKRAGKFAARNAGDPLSAGGYGQRRAVRATGGRIPGVGERDTVPVGPSAMAAPGELIVNKHTERRINQFLGGSTTLGREVQKEQRGHASQLRQLMGGIGGAGGYSTGGRGRGTSGPTTGLRSSVPLGGVHAGVLRTARAVESRFPGLTITSGTGGGHVSGSFHYRGEAVDIAGAQAEMDAAAAWINRSGLYRSLEEGIHNPNLSIAHGQRVSPSYYSAVWANHRNHIHLAVTGGGGGARGPALVGTGGGAIHLRRRRSGLGGVPGMLADASIGAQTRGMEHMVNRRLARRGAGGSLDGFSGGGSAGANRRLGRRMMLAAGYPESEWAALNPLWTGESGWNARIRNRSSGATGIPQALPGSKMASAGADWATNPATQIKWGLGYIRQRYGSPSRAYAAWLSRSPHWYARGGRVGAGTAYIGDSLGVGTAPYLPGARSNVKVGRSSASGVDALQGMSGYERLIFDLGTNDPSASALTRSLRRADRISGNVPIYVPTVHGPGARQKNAALRRLAGGDIHLLNPGSEGIGPDGIHYTGAGYRHRASVFAGAFRSGGRFRTRGPTTFMAGEGGNPVEDVHVIPRRPKRRPAGVRPVGNLSGGGVHVDVTFAGPVSVRSDADIAKLADLVGDRVGKKLAGYLEDDHDKDEALIGG